jgi:hypothetical protein
MAAASAPAPAGVARKFLREVRASDFESDFSFMFTPLIALAFVVFL